jgi:hypothetical protein
MPEGRAQNARPWRRGHAAAQNVPCAYRSPVVAMVRGFLGRDYRSFKRHTGEQTLSAAVGINGGGRGHRGRGFTSHGPGGNAGVGAESKISVMRESSHGAVRIQDEHKFRDLRADLWSPSGPTSSDEGRARPAIASARHDHALASFAADAETDFDDSEKGEALRVAQYAARDAALRHAPELPHNSGGLVNDLLFRGPTRGGEGEKAKSEQRADRFHGTT